MKQTTSKKVRTGLLCGALVGVLSIAGIMAYFTDGDTATNTMTVGRISIDLQEPNWEPEEDITPGQDIEKDPQVKNDGENDAYIFLKVSVPYANVTVANENGTKGAKADTELFSYDVNEGWVEVGAAVKNEDEGTMEHLYAYGSADAMTTVAKNETTPALFNYVRFANVIEGEGLEGTTQDIVIDAYGIQTLNVNDGTDINGDNADGKVAPTDVWAVLNNQLPSTTVEVEEAENTDIKQSE